MTDFRCLFTVALSKKGLELRPNGTFFHFNAIKGEPILLGSVDHKNLIASASTGCRAIFRNAFSMSAIQAYRFIRNRIVVESRSGFRFGPVSRTSFKLGPYFDLAAPSKLDGFLLCSCPFCRPDGEANRCGDRHTPSPPPQQTDCLSAVENPSHSPSSLDGTSLAGLACSPVSLWQLKISFKSPFVCRPWNRSGVASVR